MTAVLFFDKARKRGLVAGLEWRALQHYDSSNLASREIRKFANEYDANLVLVHAVDSGSGVQATLGMYTFDDPDEQRPRELHSLGALLVRAHPTHLNMVLAWRLEEKTVVIVVQGGIPIVDAIKGHEDANQLVNLALQGEFGFSNHVLFSNDTTFFATSEPIDEDSFWHVCAKETRLVRIPLPKLSILIFVITLALIIGGIVLASRLQKIHKLKELQAQIKATDPLPAYQDLLAINITKMGMDRKSMHETFSQIQNFPVWEAGWLLTKIECSVEKCISFWDRKGGTTNQLLQTNKGILLPTSTDEHIQLQWKSKLIIAGIKDLSKATRESTARTQNTNTFQVWRNAKIDVTESVENFKIWPTPTVGNVGELQNEFTLRTRSVEATVPLPLAEQLIDQTPPAIWWNSFTLTFSPGEKAQLLKVKFKGLTYVH